MSAMHWRPGSAVGWTGVAVGALLVAGLAGCASADPKLYTLVPTDPAGPVVAGAVGAGVLELRGVTIPGYLDRPEIVRSAADYRVHLAQDERWSEPFGDLLQRTLAADLARRRAGVVYSSSGSVSAVPAQVVEIDVSRMDADGAGRVVLDAAISVHAPQGPADAGVTRQVHLTMPVSGPGTDSYAAALSAAAGRLADAVVQAAAALGTAAPAS